MYLQYGVLYLILTRPIFAVLVGLCEELTVGKSQPADFFRICRFLQILHIFADFVDFADFAGFADFGGFGGFWRILADLADFGSSHSWCVLADFGGFEPNSQKLTIRRQKGD
jgi:hypothetical protein